MGRGASWSSIAAIAAAVVATGKAEAYTDYAAGCKACHGSFNTGTYTSLKDGVSWGTDLMSGHLDNMIGGNNATRCDVCHKGAQKSPVDLNSSNTALTLPTLGCMGCHGRAGDNVAGNPDFGSKTGYGAGLRQHHHKKNVTVCAGCHQDANPANYTTVGENVLPPYYGNTSFPLLPTNPCNANGTSENKIGGTTGLDNDGDNVYDGLDTNCSVVVDAGADATTDAATGGTGGTDGGATDASTGGTGGTTDASTGGTGGTTDASTGGTGGTGGGGTDAATGGTGGSGGADAAIDGAAGAAAGSGGTAGSAAGGSAGSGGSAGFATGGAGGGAGTSGTGATGGVADAGVGGAAGSAGSSGGDSGEDEGCGCSVPGKHGPRGGWLALAFALALGAARRKRR